MSTATRLKYTRTEATGGSGSYEYTLHWEQVSDTSINGTLTYYVGEYSIDLLIPETEYKVWLETTDTGTSTTVNADGSISSITSETDPYPQISIGTTSIDQIVLGYTDTDALVNKNTANTISILAVTAGATGSAAVSPNYIYKVCYSIQDVVDPTFVVAGNEWIISNTNQWTETPPFGYGGLNITNLEPFTQYYFTVFVYDQALLELNVEYVTPVFISSYSSEETTLFTTPTLATVSLIGPSESGTFIYTGEITSYGGGDLLSQGSEGFGLCYDVSTEMTPTIDDNKTAGDSINDATNQFIITVAVTAADYNVSGFVQNSEGTTLTNAQLVNVTEAPS
jgi:hypothetical protein